MLQNYGYKVEVIKGYKYEKGIIFKEYIDYFYNVKMNSSGVDRVISKLMLNSLYGKFGMSPRMVEKMKVINRRG